MALAKVGQWALARRILSSGSDNLKNAIGTAVRQEAELLRKEIVQGITSQAPGGSPIAPPSPLTLAARRLSGFKGSKGLIVRADLRNAVATTVDGDAVFVGVPRKAKRKKGEGLVDVAKILEFGAGPIVIPMTPAMRRFLFAAIDKAGITRRPGPRAVRGVVVLRIPARPFLRPAFEVFRKNASDRFLRRVAAILGLGSM